MNRQIMFLTMLTMHDIVICSDDPLKYGILYKYKDNYVHLYNTKYLSQFQINPVMLDKEVWYLL